MPRFTDIPKRTRNAIVARIEQIIKKHGFTAFKLTAEHYIKHHNEILYMLGLMKATEQTLMQEYFRRLARDPTTMRMIQ